MRIFVVILGLVSAALTGLSPAVAADKSKPVAVDIMVVRAFRKAGEMDKRLKKQVKLTKQILGAGFKSATVSDAVKTKVEIGARVALQVLQSPKPRLLQVKVKEVTAKKTIKLTVGIKSLDFEIDTEHSNGGTIVVAHPQGPDAALFLAVTPKLAP